jgi:opacity protein-like surface antigen
MRYTSGRVFLACLISSLSAAMYAGEGAPYLGMRLGANTGGSWNLTNPMGKTTPFGISGESLGLFGGYAYTFAQKGWVSGEGFLDDTVTRTANKATDTQGTKVKMRGNYSVGASVLPGYFITPDMLLFVRVGIVGSRFELTTTSPLRASATTGQIVMGGQLGAGIGFALSKSLLLRGEYTYSAYQSFQAAGNRVLPRTNQLFAGLAYQFV